MKPYNLVYNIRIHIILSKSCSSLGMCFCSRKSDEWYEEKVKAPSGGTGTLGASVWNMTANQTQHQVLKPLAIQIYTNNLSFSSP